MKRFLIIIVILAGLELGTSSPLSKFGGFFTKRPIKNQTPVVALVVEIPMSTSVHYKKPLDVQTGGRFYLETPMERYSYSSAGRSNLRRVKIAYLMQSMYRPNHMCFFLHFWSMKDPTVPWDIPRIAISR